MIVIRFSDHEAEGRALGFLPGRFSFIAYRTGEILVPAAALSVLAEEGFVFSVEGRATYSQSIPALRTFANS
jgi:hypothetical protein